MVGRRARDESEKEERSGQILDAARTLFTERDFAGVTMAAVAAEAGLAKGTVYLYYSTKEQLFLSLLLAEVQDWFVSLAADMPSAGPIEARALATRVAKDLAERPLLMRLLGLAHSVLERNIDAETALSFKKTLHMLLRAAWAVVQARVPTAPRNGGVRLLLRIYASVVGLSLLANPSSVMREILDAEGRLNELTIDFQTEVRETIALMLGAPED